MTIRAVQINEKALNEAVIAGNDRAWSGRLTVAAIRAAITAYLTSAGEGAVPPGWQADDWQLTTALQNANEKLEVAIQQGSVTLGVGWLRGMAKFLEHVQPVPTSITGATTTPAPKDDAGEGAVPVGYMRPEDVGKLSFWVSCQESSYYRKPVYAAAPHPPRQDGAREGEDARLQELQEIADGAWGDGPMRRGQARDLLLKATTPPAPDEAAAWCQPRKNGEPSVRQFIVRFEDADKGDAVFDDEGEAYAFWERANTNWNCYLFGAMPLRSRRDAGGGHTIQMPFWRYEQERERAADAAVAAERAAIVELIRNGKEVRVPRVRVHLRGETEVVALDERELISAILARGYATEKALPAGVKQQEAEGAAKHQPQTFLGLRGMTEVKGILFRQLYRVICDRFRYYQGDPDAATQMTCCEIEKLMGIYPNVPRPDKARNGTRPCDDCACGDEARRTCTA